jgi:hypothetical protein
MDSFLLRYRRCRDCLDEFAVGCCGVICYAALGVGLVSYVAALYLIELLVRIYAPEEVLR